MPKKKEKTFAPFELIVTAPDISKNVVVITHKYNYQGIIVAHGLQDGVVKKVLVDSHTLWRGQQWESVHDVFEVE
jgi:hypothetical protein